MKKVVPSSFFALALGAYSAIFFSACQRHTISPKDTITTSISAPVNTIDPLYATDADGQHIGELVHAGLTRISTNLLPEPYLAEKIRTVNDLTLEFTLKKGCTLHDGTEITADLVAEVLELFQNDKAKSAFQEMAKKIVRFEKLGPYKFRIYTEKPTPALLVNLRTIKLFSPKDHNIGAGPYRLVKISPQEVALEAHSSPCVPTPATPKVKIKVVRDDLSRYLKLKNGEMDISLNELNFRKLEHIGNDPKSPLAVISAPGTGVNYMGINMKNPKLQDLRVRKALQLSLDLPLIMKYKNRGYATPSRSVLSDLNWYANKDIKIPERNLAEARRLLDEAGYYNGQNSKPVLTIKLSTTTNNIVLEHARAIVMQAKDAGIEIQHRTYEWATFYADVKAKNTELYLLRWVGTSDPSLLFENFHSGELSRNNRTNYINPTLDKWLEKGESTLDFNKRKAYYAEAQKIVAEDLPYIHLWHNKNAAVYRKNISNIILYPTGSWEMFVDLRKE
jgi:peptide/nickel transport system substrate-binding protein